jgi:hypothetical protein
VIDHILKDDCAVAGMQQDGQVLFNATVGEIKHIFLGRGEAQR